MPNKIDTEQALQLYKDGLTDAEIARRIGVSPGGVTRWRAKNELQPHRNKPPVLTSEQTRQARKLLRKGMTLQQVADRVGCSKATAMCIRKAMPADQRLRKHGVTLQRAHRTVTANPADILAELKAATRHVTDAVLRDDVMGDMFLAMMEGLLQRQQIKSEARRYCGRAIDQWQSKWAPASIDEALTADGLRLIDLIACPSAQDWIEEMGA